MRSNSRLGYAYGQISNKRRVLRCCAYFDLCASGSSMKNISYFRRFDMLPLSRFLCIHILNFDQLFYVQLKLNTFYECNWRTMKSTMEV